MINEVCSILKNVQNNNVNSIHMVVVELLSTLICPVYGDFYSFPWKRGPHDNILEYIEALQTFESLRELIFNQLKEWKLVPLKLRIVMIPLNIRVSKVYINRFNFN